MNMTILFSQALFLLVAVFGMQTPARSVWDAVYTEVQAKRGEETFSKSCAACHDSSEFASPAFMKQWSGRTVFDLFDEISAVMPMDAPGKLEKQAYIDVVAFIFRCNSFPAGETELDLKEENLRQIRIEAKGR